MVFDLTDIKCRAYQVSDQKTCPECRLTWDMNDPAPPECGRVQRARAIKKEVERLHTTLRDYQNYVLIEFQKYAQQRLRLGQKPPNPRTWAPDLTFQQWQRREEDRQRAVLLVEFQKLIH